MLSPVTQRLIVDLQGEKARLRGACVTLATELEPPLGVLAMSNALAGEQAARGSRRHLDRTAARSDSLRSSQGVIVFTNFGLDLDERLCDT